MTEILGAPQRETVREEAGQIGLAPSDARRRSVAGGGLESFSETGSAPNAWTESFPRSLLLGPPYHKQIRRTAPFCVPAPFLLTVNGRFLFGATEKKMGVHSRAAKRHTPVPAPWAAPGAGFPPLPPCKRKTLVVKLLSLYICKQKEAVSCLLCKKKSPGGGPSPSSFPEKPDGFSGSPSD